MELAKRGIATKTLNALAKRGIRTEEDLVRLFPRKYKDYRKLTHIDDTQAGRHYAVPVTLRSVELKSKERKYLALKAYADSSNPFVRELSVSILFFSRTFLYRRFSGMIGKRVVVMGSVSYDSQYGYSFSEPDDIVLQDEWQGHIATVYTKIGGISDSLLRTLIEETLNRTHEPFEWELMQKIGSKHPDYVSALKAVHYPTDQASYRAGLARVQLNDLLYFALGLKRMQAALPQDTALCAPNRTLLNDFMAKLPFELTSDQLRIVESIRDDMASGKRVDMLLQGDVGSGKTVVGLAAAVIAAGNGMQAVLMAPRSVLAAQHYETAKELLGWPDNQIAFLHSGMKQSERRKLISSIKDGRVRLVVGTHSCIADDVVYHKLGVVITDEEHLFGVRQKEKIVEKASLGAHVISMSATPIPRTLASSIYGTGKQVEQIISMPKGRLPIKTGVVEKYDKIFPFLLRELRAGHQAYVVCPSIEESEDNGLVSVEETERTYREYFEPLGVRIGVATGKMDRTESERVVSDFSSGQIDVLISTTVIEVGVNVPNATVIVIEQAERFGLASLHQLRGRVGRSSIQSYCLLHSEEGNNDRLQTICRTTNGFEIAEADFAQRGSGNLLGLKQSGSNKFIELMLAKPDLYREAGILADYCMNMELGDKLVSLYPDREGD